jgi:hypothetical protein
MSEEQVDKKKKLDRLRTSKEFQPQPAAIDESEIQVLLTHTRASSARLLPELRTKMDDH